MAVYTQVSSDALDTFVADYDIGGVLSYKGIAEGVENSNYLLHTERGNFILTLYEKRVAPEDLPYFLGLMDFLAANGIPCATPIHGRDGGALRELAGRPAAIVKFLEGVCLSHPGPGQCKALGRQLARLHKVGASFPMTRANALSMNSWGGLHQRCAQGADSVITGLNAALIAELKFLENAWPSGLPEGVIHADLFPDNVFFLGGEISGFIDFYFACNDWLAFDLAICLNAWCFDAASKFQPENAAALVEGYESERPLELNERDAIPLLARGAALRFLLTRLYDWLHHDADALVRPKDPQEYYDRLKFHQSVNDASAYGFRA